MLDEHFRYDGGKFPVGEMSGKAEHRLAAVQHAPVALDRFRRVGDQVRRLPADALDTEFIEVGELDRDPPEIVPDAGEDLLDLSLGFFRKGGTQVLAGEPVFLEQRADLAHRRAGGVRRAPAVEALDRAEQSDGAGADRRIEQGFESPFGHQNVTTILPKTWRLSSRARPRSKSASATSVSITGSRPDAIFARLSRMLRMETPNEPKMRYCCWNKSR